MGTILVAASNSHTVYTFDSDSPSVSRFNGGCATTWPPLTIASGQTPTGGPGVTGQLGTITRADGSLQVTYKGLPLYFFHSATKPGDTKGNYTGWSLAKPSADVRREFGLRPRELLLLPGRAQGKIALLRQACGDRRLSEVEGLELLVDVRRDVRHPVTLPHAHLERGGPAVAAVEKLLVGEPQVAGGDRLPLRMQPSSPPHEL
jgi:predicted lipoprotein with Yx(FWY)xxD motif